jgi:hypothetical protein
MISKSHVDSVLERLLTTSSDASASLEQSNLETDLMTVYDYLELFKSLRTALKVARDDRVLVAAIPVSESFEVRQSELFGIDFSIGRFYASKFFLRRVGDTALQKHVRYVNIVYDDSEAKVVYISLIGEPRDLSDFPLQNYAFIVSSDFEI